MATKNDFEQRQRERRRMERQRAQRNKTILIAAAGVIVLGILIISVVSCSTKKKDNTSYVPENVNNGLTAQTSQPPAVTPVPEIEGIKDIPSPEENNDLLDIVENSGNDYYAYITFDDGPNKKVTPQILDTLRRYNVKATFFQVGEYIRQNKDMARRAYDEGHLIASHSDSHNYEKLYASESAFLKEAESSYDTICEITGEEPFKLIRFPGGSNYSSKSESFRDALADKGFYYIDWNTLIGDAEGRPKDAEGLLEFLKDTMPKSGENVVILMHDSQTKQSTADALGPIIEYLYEEGYSFHRLDDIPYNAGAASARSDSRESDSAKSTSRPSGGDDE